MIKLKDLIKEHAWDRKFGEPLPTLEDVMREAEVDDDKIIKYKDKDGESQEMTAGAAKKMDKDHPAKQAWDKLADKGGKEEPKGKGLEPDDFERDFDPEKPEDGEESNITTTSDGTEIDWSQEVEPDDLWGAHGDIKRTRIKKTVERLIDKFEDARNSDNPDTEKIMDLQKQIEHMVKIGLGQKKTKWQKGILPRRTGRELETITVNGKKYRPIKESTKPILTEAPSWYKDGAKLVRKVMKKHRIKPISGGGSMSTWGRIAQKIPDRQEFAYSIKPNYEYVELYRSDRDQKSKKIAILAKKIVKDIKKAGMGASFDGDFSINYNSQDIAK